MKRINQKCIEFRDKILFVQKLAFNESSEWNLDSESI